MKKLDKNKIINIIIISVLIILTIIRIGLWIKTPILIYTEELNDDKLLYDYAKTIAEGKWLGEYSQLTLVKGISFSVFEAICNKIMLPYSVGMAILNIVSSLLICIALSKKIDKKYLYFVYLVLLYSPVGFTSLISQRNYRNAIIPYTVIMIFAGYIGLFLRKDKSIKNFLGWSLISSISLIFFWFVKEDSIWILPFILTISILIIIYWIINDRNKIVFKTAILVIPFICLFMTNTLISSINNKYYGIYAVSDKSGAEFGKMMSNLYKIEDSERTAGEDIWITNNMLQKAFSVSPTLSELKPSMDVCAAWTDGDWEVAGDLMVWKIRYVMSVHNYYETASKAEEFCRNVNSELEVAFSNGSLKEDNKIHIASQIRGLSLIDLINFIPSGLKWLSDFSKYDNCGITESLSIGKETEIKEIQNFLHLPENIDNEEFVKVQKHSNNIVNVYKNLAVLTNGLAVIGYVSFTIFTIYKSRKKDFSGLDIWFISTGVILSSIVLAFELNIFCDFFSPENLSKYRTFYAAGTFPLIEIAKCINIYLLGISIFELVKNYKEKKKVNIKPSSE